MEFRYDLEMFGHLVADRASACLAYRPHELSKLFAYFKAECEGDADRLRVIDDVEDLAAALGGAAYLGRRVIRRR